MTPVIWWLGRGMVALTIIALLALSVTLFGSSDSIGRVALGNYLADLDKCLRFLRSKILGLHVFSAQIVLAIGISSSALVARQWVLLLSLPAIAIGPKVVVARRVARRVAEIDAQVEPWINTVANALRACPSLGDAITSSASLLQPPISQELDVLAKEYELGTPLDEALENLSERVNSRTLTATVQALKIARKSGGNLTELLESSAASLREFARLEGVVRTKTAEGKAQVFVIGLIPLPMVLGINSMDSHFFEPLFGSLLGQLVISLALVLWLAAVLLARKILDVDI